MTDLRRFVFLRLQGVPLDTPVFNDVSDSPSPPPPPDYTGAAIAQGQANVDAARVTGKLNRPDEYNPYGSRTWTDLGNDRFRVDTNFTPIGQDLFDKDLALKQRFADTATGAMDRVNTAVGRPLDLSNGRDAIVDAMYRRSTRLMDPRYTQGEEALKSELVNKGFSVGTEGYDRALANFNREKESAYSDAMDRATTSGAQQRIAELLTERNIPMQELNALRTGAMPQMPQFQNYAGTGPVQPAPMFAAAQAAGNSAMQQYQLQNQNSNNFMSGLFSLGAGWLSGGMPGLPA